MRAIKLALIVGSTTLMKCDSHFIEDTNFNRKGLRALVQLIFLFC